MTTLLAEEVLGAWQLVSFTNEDPLHGTTHPLGEDAVGIILYTPDGYMSAQVMRVEHPVDASDAADSDHTSPGGSGYLAYSGPYTVDETEQTLHHHVDVSLLPAWLHTVQTRHADLDGDRLTLTAQDDSPDGITRSTIVWRRPAAEQ